MSGNKEQQQAAWIWYPDDYEIWLHAKSALLRQYRGQLCPPVWRLDTAYVNVMFRKAYTLDQPEVLELAVQGDFVLHLDGSMDPMPHARQQPVTTVQLPAGSHELVVKVANMDRIPAIYASSPSIISDSTWEVTCHNARWLPAAAAHFYDRLNPPGPFPFSYEAVQPTEIQDVEGEAGSKLVDFGKETFGYITLEGVSGTGLVALYYGESLEEAMAGEGAETHDVLHIDEGQCQIKTAVSRAFRYVKVVASAGVAWERVWHQYEYLPVELAGSFRSSNERLNHIWEVSAHTLHMNTREFFYDGMKRDRWVWSGDAYQAMLINNYSFSEQNVAKRTLVALRGKEPVEIHINTIMDYTFYWFIALQDYYMYTGDLVFVQSCYPKMVSLIEFCLRRRNESGMMEGYPEDWVFIDWAPMERRGELCAEQLLFCRSLQTIALFARELGDGAQAERYGTLAEELYKRIFDLFWDSSKGAFIHGRYEGQLNGQVLKYPNMFALRFGYLSAEQREQVRWEVLLNEDVQKITTPFMRFFELEALAEAGELKHVIGEIAAYWGGMLELGATTFWEEYDPTLPAELQYDMYGGKYRKSLCHAWGAAPIYLMGKYVLGVRPEAPGYARYTITPQLAGMEWVEGAVPTPHGTIEVYASEHVIRVKAAAAGEGILRFASKQQPEVSEGKLVAIGEGQYELQLTIPGQQYDIRLGR